MAEQRPKFTPQETPLSNWNQGVVAWSFFSLSFDSPLGPRVNQYDPYYIYSVGIQQGEQVVDYIWFTSVEDHIRIQMAGGTKGSQMKASYIKDQKKKALVIEYAAGPMVQRSENVIRAQVKQAVDTLTESQEMNQADSPASSFDSDNLINSPGGHQEAAGLSAPLDPFSSPVAPTPIQPAQAPTSLPHPTASAAPAQPVAPPAPQYQPAVNSRNYTKFNDSEKAAWKARFADIAELQLFAYAAILERGKELGIKIKPSDQRELATSVSIQTWREFSSKGGLYGWSFLPPPELPDNTTKDGALRCMDLYVQGQYADKAEFIKVWLDDVAEPVESIGTWKHAANIANLLGIDSQVVYDEFEADAMMLIAQAIWVYAGGREEGMTMNESLNFAAEEYDLPKEAMKFEEETEEEDE